MTSIPVPPDLLARYDVPGPRYTSYPTVPAWTTRFGPMEYREALAELADTGAAVGWSSRLAEVRLDYQREVDRESRHFASERTAVSLDFHPRPRWSLVAGAEYDLARSASGRRLP